ncbi:hypothetical protein B0H14DRAFT_2203863, partial [Mycena olivaceomarginata]
HTFSYKKSKKTAASDSVRTYSYYCAQNEDEVQKPHLHAQPHKRRARMKMDRFPCQGTLQITVDDDQLHVPLRLKLKHHLAHLHYVDISVSQSIKDLVESMKNDTAANIWTRVIRENRHTEITEKQVYALW